MESLATLPVTDDVRAWLGGSAGEVEAAPAAVEGTLPEWLEGTLVRNGGAFVGTPGPARHLFDQSAMLHRFAFAGGRATYGSRFLRTRARAALEEGRIGYREFASDPCRRLAEPIATLFSPRFTDNANVNVARLGDQFLALTETPLPVAFDPRTLATLGVEGPPPPGRGVRSPTAHPHTDGPGGEWLTTQVHFGARSSYRVYRRPPAGRASLLAKIPVREPSYLHSFAVTERHVVIAEQPFRVRPLDLLKAGKPFIEQYRWQPEEGITFVVLDRATGRVLRRQQAPPRFAFHHVNAFDDGRELVLDLCTYDDPSLIGALYRDALASPAAKVPAATLHRYRLGQRGDAACEVLCDTPFEWPRVRPGSDGRRHRAAFGVGAHQAPGGPVAAITRVEPDTGAVDYWSQAGCFPGEPVVVAGPGGAGHGEGVVLSVVFDAAGDGSFLLVLDEATLHEVARVHAPAPIPFGFHGDYFPGI